LLVIAALKVVEQLSTAGARKKDNHAGKTADDWRHQQIPVEVYRPIFNVFSYLDAIG